MADVTRFVLDASARRIDDGKVLLAGSPLVLFRLTPAGRRIVDAIEAGDELPGGHERLTDRLLDAGAIHPLPTPASGPPPSDVTVVIPAFDAPAGALARLVIEVRRAAPSVHPVIVVDDGSPVPIGSIAHARTLRLDTNRGPGAARNAGLAEVVTPFVAFLDSDVTVGGDWLGPLLPHFADPRVALVAPRVRSTPGPTALERYEGWRSPLDLGPLPARVRAGTRVSYVPAAALVARTDALRAVGGFDEDLRFGEDVDLVWRLDEVGHRLRYEPAVSVEHASRGDWRAWWRQRASYGRSAAPLASRHHGALAPARASGWSALAWGVGVGVSPVGGVAIGAGTVVALARKLRALDHPLQESLRLAGLGNLFAGRILASAVTRAWWPIALAAALVSRRARRIVVAAMLVPPLIDWVRDRPPLDPARAIAVRVADDVAYGTGLWQGMRAERSIDALVPDLTSWPNPPRGQRRPP
jgi:mycofactocin system glycosyltransferase